MQGCTARPVAASGLKTLVSGNDHSQPPTSMKNLFASFAMLSVLFLFSCKKDEKTAPTPVSTQKSPIASAKTADGYTVELLGDTNVLFTGYNKLYFQIKDAAGQLVTNATPEVTPLMDMTTMSHSTPHDAVQWNSSENLYSSAATFIMPTTPDGNWYLSVKMSGNTTKMPVTVKDYPTKVLNSAKGSDSVFYYAALVRPKAWTVGMNDITFAVYKKESMMDFPAVSDLTLQMTPEMPSMGHGSPNNVAPTSIGNGLYKGRVNFTMTGDWRIHLKLSRNGSEIVNDIPLDILF